jgi:hypothetical protein
MTGRADTGGVQRLLHQLLVAETRRLLHVEPRDAEGLPKPGRQHDAGLPQAFDPVESGSAQPGTQRPDDRILVPQRGYRDVIRKEPAHQWRQAVPRRVAHADDTGAGFGQPTREFRHVGRVTGGKQQDIHHFLGRPGLGYR